MAAALCRGRIAAAIWARRRSWRDRSTAARGAAREAFCGDRRVNGFALLDPEAGEHGVEKAVPFLDRLSLDQFVDRLPIGDAARAAIACSPWLPRLPWAATGCSALYKDKVC
jgi:hypothetical protein